MPNWVDTHLRVYGKRDTLKRILNECKTEDSEFSFNTFYPMPDGYPDWYTWRISNWGTKWDANDPYVDDFRDNLYIEFNTAWSFAEGAIRKFVETYDVVVSGEWLDEDIFGGNCGTFRFEHTSNGEVEGSADDGLTKRQYAELFGYDEPCLKEIYGDDFEWPEHIKD